jgi:hypothetical protein
MPQIKWQSAVLLSLLVLLLRRSAFAATIITNNLFTQIVNCQDGVDVDALIKEYGLTPKYIYRCALNGFAAPMAATPSRSCNKIRILETYSALRR